ATWLGHDVQVNQTLPATVDSSNAGVAAVGSSVFVTWADTRNSPVNTYDIYFNRSLDGGATWLTQDVRLDTDAPGSSNSNNPRIAASGSSVYVVWRDTRNGAGDIYFNRSLDGGVTWSTQDVRLDTDAPGAAESQDVQIAASGSRVFAVWWDQRNGIGAS